jgi:hypothetical protein
MGENTPTGTTLRAGAQVVAGIVWLMGVTKLPTLGMTLRVGRSCPARIDVEAITRTTPRRAARTA